jgi:hypothetical protein
MDTNVSLVDRNLWKAASLKAGLKRALFHPRSREQPTSIQNESKGQALLNTNF